MKKITLKPLYSVKTGITPLGIAVASIITLVLMYVSPMLGVSAGASFAFLGNVMTPEQAHAEEMAALKAIEDRMKNEFAEFKTKMEGKVSKDAMASYESAIAEIKTSLDKLATDLAAEEADGEEVEESVKEIENSIKTINDNLSKLQTKMTEALEDIAAQKNGKNKGKKGAWVSSEEIEKFIKDTFHGETGDRATKKTKDVTALNMDFFPTVRRKAAEDFQYPTFFEGGADIDISAFVGRTIDPTLYQRRRKKNLILDYFDIQTVNAPILLYLEKVEISGTYGSSTDTGGAEWIVSGQQKPKRSFRVTTGKVEAKKVAIFGTVDDKLLRDIPSLENWIREDFTDEIKEAYNDALLNNNPAVDPDAPLGLKQNAIQFDPTPAFTNTILLPNYIDMIMAAAAQMAELKEQAAIAFVTWDVYYRIITLKDQEGRYMNNDKVYVDQFGNLFVGGVQVVPVNSEDVPSTHLLLIGMEVGFKIRNYGPLVFERGLNGNDFREDKTSYRGYQEVLSYIATHRENSVLYDEWDTIEAGIVQTS